MLQFRVVCCAGSMKGHAERDAGIQAEAEVLHIPFWLYLCSIVRGVSLGIKSISRGCCDFKRQNSFFRPFQPRASLLYVHVHVCLLSYTLVYALVCCMHIHGTHEFVDLHLCMHHARTCACLPVSLLVYMHTCTLQRSIDMCPPVFRYLNRDLCENR